MPRPLAEPLAGEGAILTFDAIITAPPAEVRRGEARELSLSALLRIVEVSETSVQGLSELRSVSPWVDSDIASRHGLVWPTPHDTVVLGPSFDGAADHIAELAISAARVLGEWWRQPDRVLGHDDWEAQNLRFGRIDGRPAVVAIFDPEALALMPEPVLAGASGLQHGRGLTGAPDAPTFEEVGAWIESFATRCGGRSMDWIRAAWAAAAWSLAYNARCDELLGVDADDSHLQACRNDADQYLANLGR